MEEEIENILKSITSRRFKSFYVERPEDANKKILDLIPINAVVGIGDSTTVGQIGIKGELKKRGTKLLDAWDIESIQHEEQRNKLTEEATVCDVFLTGTNAITKDGRLVNLDATGNRVAGMFWGHPMSIIVVGKNKIVKDLDEAFHRIRTIIAPNHMKIGLTELGGRQSETPCAITGECKDCRAYGRICNIFTIIEGKPRKTDITVIIINEDLGLSWDSLWPRERINNIIERYKFYRASLKRTRGV